MNAITYYSEAIKKVDNGEITIGEYERMINVLRDVEPVVRCKDCKHYDGEMCRQYSQFYTHHWNLEYCSHGERKDD